MGGAISVLDDGGRGATDCKNEAALEEADVSWLPWLEEELCLCALFKLGKAGGASSSSIATLGPSVALSNDSPESESSSAW